MSGPQSLLREPAYLDNVLEDAPSGPSTDESESFEGFFEAERDGLFGAMCLITGNRSEAEDLTQEAFVAVWERWGRIRSLDDPTGYLYRTAMNGFRKRTRRAALAIRKAVRLASRDEFAAAESRHVVRRALAGLSPRQRAALVLTELLGFTSEEAGHTLGIRPVTVRVLASQGRAALRSVMGRPNE